MFKNWEAIIASWKAHMHQQAILVACVETENQIKLAENTFPKLFQDQKSEYTGLFPLSFLRAVVERWLENEGIEKIEDRGATSFILKSIGVPCRILAQFSADAWTTDPDCITLVDQVSIHVYEGHFHRYMRGECFPFDLNRIQVEGKLYFVGSVSNPGSREDNKSMFLFPCERIDVDM